MRVAFSLALLLAGGSVAQAQAHPHRAPARRSALASCPSDPALSRTAAAALASEFGADARAMLDKARAEGSTAPVLRAVRVALADERRAHTFVARLAAETRGPIVCGEARDEEELVVIAAPALGRLSIDAGRVRGELARSYDRPFLVYRFEDGTYARASVDRRALARGVALPEEAEDAPTTIQLVGTGPEGPRPLAELTINGSGDTEEALGDGSFDDASVDEARRDVSTVDASADAVQRTPDHAPTDAHATGEVSTDTRAADAARRAADDRAEPRDDVAERLVARRSASHAPQLRDNRLLREAARAHADEVCREGRVAHRLSHGDPEERLRARGISARVVGETVARGASVGDAMDALERSPSHQMTLLDRRFTDVGVGTARDADGKRCLVVLLAAWPRFVGR